MKTLYLFSILFIVLCSNFSASQSIEAIVNTVNTSKLELGVNELSGEQATLINGISQTIVTRVYNNNDLAANYIEERLSAFPNLSIAVQNFNTTGKNIIATQLGKTNPNNIYIVCAHYDSVTEFCADDNATGVSAVMEMARILSQQCTENTIIYAFWDEEELGLLGSKFYAEQAAEESNGNSRDNILGVINLDMIGFDSDAPGAEGDNDFDIDVRNIANSLAIKDDLLSILNTYTLDLNATVVNPGTTASDHSRFWNEDYSALLVGESWSTNDQSIHYHTSDDKAEDIDFQYMTEITKLVTAYLATKAGLLALDNSVDQIANSLTATETSAAYQWFNCDTDSEISGANNRTFTPTANGNYAVEVSNDECSEKSACINFSMLSINEFSKEELNVYPNPIISTLKIDNVKSYNLSITINDIAGKVIYTLNSNKAYLEMNLKNESAGIYFITIASKAQSSTLKLVKK